MLGRRTTLELVRWLLLAIVVAGGIWYAARHPEVVSALKGVPLVSLLAILVLELVARVLQGYKLKLMSGVFGVGLRFREWFGLTVCASMYSYLLPARAGAGVQALYLKKQYGLPFAHFGSLVAAMNVLILVVAGAVGLCASVIQLSSVKPTAPTLLFVFLGLFVLSMGGCAVLAVLTSLVKYVPTQALRQIASSVSDGLKMLARRRDVLLKVSGLHVAHIICGGAQFYIAFRSLGMEATLSQGIVVSALSAFAMFLALTPASLGINEGVISAAGQLLGLSAQKALVGAVVYRGVTILVSFALGWVFNHVLLRGVMIEGGSAAESRDAPKT